MNSWGDANVRKIGLDSVIYVNKVVLFQVLYFHFQNYVQFESVMIIRPNSFDQSAAQGSGVTRFIFRTNLRLI